MAALVERSIRETAVLRESKLSARSWKTLDFSDVPPLPQKNWTASGVLENRLRKGFPFFHAQSFKEKGLPTQVGVKICELEVQKAVQERLLSQNC